jgi:hypothetical protein
MNLSSAFLLALLVTVSFSAFSQATPQPSGGSPIAVSATVQPALSDVQRCVSDLNISRWKAPNEVRNSTQQNVASIQRDFTGTLPGLLSQADASPSSVPSAFAVYRNIDALYDVLLRVSGTANLAAPQGESDEIFAALQKLEAARTQLGDAILQASQQREAEVIKLQLAAKAVPPPQAVPQKPAVIDDGPAAAPVKRKKKPAPKPAPSTPSAAPAPSGN